MGARGIVVANGKGGNYEVAMKMVPSSAFTHARGGIRNTPLSGNYEMIIYCRLLHG